MEQYRYQDAIHCHLCDNVVYSINRHDFRGCGCGNVSVDGGRDYTKTVFKDPTTFSKISLDLLTDAPCNQAPDPKSTHGKKEKAKKGNKTKRSTTTSKSKAQKRKRLQKKKEG